MNKDTFNGLANELAMNLKSEQDVIERPTREGQFSKRLYA